MIAGPAARSVGRAVGRRPVLTKGGVVQPYTTAELAALIAAAGGSWWSTSDLTAMWQGADSGGGNFLLAGSAAAEGQHVAYVLDIAQFSGLSASDFIAAQTELVVNGGMDSDTVWSKGTGWGIAAGIATHAGTTASNMSQAILTQNDWYFTRWTQSAHFVSVYLGFGTGHQLLGNVNSAGAKTSIGQSTAAGTSLAFRTNIDGATVDDVSEKRLPGRPARATGIATRPNLSANSLLAFDGADDLLVANIVSALGSACTKITADGDDVVVTEGQTVGSGSYSLPDTGWTDHILLPVSLATAGISLARLNATLVP